MKRHLVSYSTAMKLFTAISLAGVILTTIIAYKYYQVRPETAKKRYERIASEQFARAFKVVLPRVNNREIANAIYVAENKLLTNKHVCETAYNQPISVMSGWQSTIYEVKEIQIDATGTDLCMLVTDKLKLDIGPITVSGDYLTTYDKLTMAGFTYRYTGRSFMSYNRSYGVILDELNFNVMPRDSQEKIDYYNAELRPYDNLLLNSLPIQPGCSGSAVYNNEGQLVGVVNSIIRGYGAFIREKNVVDFLTKAGIVFNIANKQ